MSKTSLPTTRILKMLADGIPRTERRIYLNCSNPVTEVGVRDALMNLVSAGKLRKYGSSHSSMLYYKPAAPANDRTGD